MTVTDRPEWQLPQGVSRGTWEYIHSDSVAGDYDTYFEGINLFKYDQQIVQETFVQNQSGKTVVCDFGCGTGRAILPLMKPGVFGIAVDLSTKMLRIVQQKAQQQQANIQCVQANLVSMQCLSDDCVDYAMCMFSTLGMIRGAVSRRAMLDHIRRTLKPGGTFVVHVHNFWYALRDPGGIRWVAGNILKSKLNNQMDRGDKFFPYRGVHKMFLHTFSRGELKRLLQKAGFRNLRFIPLTPQRHQPLRYPGWMQNIRANGWIVICR